MRRRSFSVLHCLKKCWSYNDEAKLAPPGLGKESSSLRSKEWTSVGWELVNDAHAFPRRGKRWCTWNHDEAQLRLLGATRFGRSILQLCLKRARLICLEVRSVSPHFSKKMQALAYLETIMQLILGSLKPQDWAKKSFGFASRERNSFDWRELLSLTYF